MLQNSKEYCLGIMKDELLSRNTISQILVYVQCILLLLQYNMFISQYFIIKI